MKLFVGILTNRDAERLERCIESLGPKQEYFEAFVVCNTLDEDYIPIARAVAEKHNVEFFITSSNGLPGRGKNSVIDLFAMGPHTHLVPIDGDDNLAPGALEHIKGLLEENPEIDVLGQRHNPMVYDGNVNTWENIIEDGLFFEYGAIEPSKRNIVAMGALREAINSVIPFNRFLILSKFAAMNFSYLEDIKACDDIIAACDLYNSDVKYFLTDKVLYEYEMTQGTLWNYFQDVKQVVYTTKLIQKRNIGKVRDVQIV